MIGRERLAVAGFVLARTTFCAYRGATQAFSSDEAFSYNDFISGKWGNLYRRYDANNHVLYSILAKLSIGAFGTSEFTLRLPSIMSGLFLMFGIYVVLAEVGCSFWVRWMTLLGLGLNPLLLDFSVAARGYSLSLALLVWAVYFFLLRHDVTAGALLGLAISANLTIIYPAIGLVVCPYLLRSGDVEKRIQGCLNMSFTALGVFGAICYEALSKATPGNFYAGIGTLAAGLMTIVGGSIRGSERAGLFGIYQAAELIVYLVLPALMLFLVGAGIRTFWSDSKRRPSLAPLLMLLTAWGALMAAHQLAGLPYPVDRLGLYLIVLCGLAWAAAVSEIQMRSLRVANGVLAGVLVIQLLTQIQARYFQVWPYDAPAKEIAHRLIEETRGRPPGSVKVSATWYTAPALEFYRRYYDIESLQPIQRFEQTPLENFDFYVLHLKDDASGRGRNIARLQPIFRDPASTVLLAKEP